MNFFLPLFLFTFFGQTVGSSSFIFHPPVQSASKYHVYDLNLGTNNIPLAAEEWTVSGLISSSSRTYQCGSSFPLMGGLGVTGTNPSFTRVYTDLPSHTYVNYLVSIFFIDHWEATDKIIFYIDGTKIFDFYPADWTSYATSNLCGGSDYDLISNHIGQVAHTQDSISIHIEGQVSSITTSFGIFQTILSFSNQVTTSPLKIIQCPGNKPQYTDVGTTCNFQYYYNYANSACEVCDSSCFFCWGPASNQCFACVQGYTFDGAACVLCSTNCGLCSSVGTCERCITNYFLNPDESCTSTCTDSTALLKGTTGIQYCIEPCPTGQFMMWNFTCTSECNLPLKVTTQSTNIFCTFPCDTDKFLNWNGTCSDSCNSPYVQFIFHDERFEPDSKYCNLPCKTNEYLFGDGSCSTTCPDTMASTMIDSLVNYCYNPTLSPEEKKKIEALNSAKSTAGKTGKAALAVLNVLLPSNPTSLISGSLQQTLEYLRYLNISRSQRLEAMFEGESSSYELITIPDVMPKASRYFADNSLPYMFEKYEVESSFLVNCGDQIISLAATYALALFSTFFNWLCKFLRNRVFLQFLSFRFKTSLKNYFIGQLYESFGVFFFFIAIEFISYDSKTDFDIISLLTAIICIIVVAILLARHYWIIQKYQSLKKTPDHLEKFKKKYQDSEILFEDYTDASFLPQAFLFFCSLRTILCNLIIGLLTSSPMAQIIFINLTSVLMLAYLLLKRPLKDKIGLIQQISFELTIFVVNLSFFINAITDKTEKDDTRVMKNTSEVIIVSNMIFAFLPLVFLVIRVLVSLVIAYKWLKLHRQKDKQRKQKNILKKQITLRKLKTEKSFADNSEILHLDGGNSRFLEENRTKVVQKKQVSRRRIQRTSRKDILNGFKNFGRFPETKTTLPPSHKKGTFAESLYH